jgi:hypothetical protein
MVFSTHTELFKNARTPNYETLKSRMLLDDTSRKVVKLFTFDQGLFAWTYPSAARGNKAYCPVEAVSAPLASPYLFYRVAGSWRFSICIAHEEKLTRC